MKVSYSAYKYTQNNDLTGTQKWLQVVWNNTYPTNHYIPPIIASFQATTFAISQFGSTQESFSP